MRPFLVLVLLAALAACAPAWAATGDSFTLATVRDGANPEWALDSAAGERNPRLEVAAGANVTLTVRNEDDGYHNLKVGGGVDRKTSDVRARGETQALQFIAPASGTLDYFCEYHPATMKGLLVVQGAGEPRGKDAPGPAAPLALLVLAGAALVLRGRRAPPP